MSNPTSNFNWQMPTNTDLVTDLPADFEVFGQAVDTSLADLKGGTTGQILSKTSNTDMDFTWTSPNPGDITGVTAGTGISGGGTSGDVTITNSMATAIDAKGDLIAGTGADAFSRLGVGSNGQVLTADSTAGTGLAWATPASGGLTLLSTTTMNSGTATQTVSSIAGGYKHLQILLIQGRDATTSAGWSFRLNGDTASNYAQAYNGQYWGGTDNSVNLGTNVYLGNRTSNLTNGLKQSYIVLNVYNYTDGGMTMCDWRALSHDGGAGNTYTMTQGILAYNASAAITSFGVTTGSTWSSGTIRIYGVK